ncbi:DUF7010 family protein [Hymenobacter wooponensis]|uniref:Uncharacterized protein n=1 Tax=Hymenobacter wooponensis TaxID=1525360 RepID=A0A4Z0MTN9_9BACT|nr:hypothetical protein [Hymenobacter wooponensis]TGD82617.1 hypothetical protein EU557_02195 [Hymenobacter wooponensis]
MPLQEEFMALRLELSVKAKNGIDFLAAASVVWAAIAFVWLLPYPLAHKAFITFFVGAATFPLAWLFSKVFRTTWSLPHNPLQPLGLWLNVAQLFYFPFLMFVYSKYPFYFIMTYGIITGAHFFPYAWFYRAQPFAIMAGIIPVGCLLLGLRLAVGQLYLIPAFMVCSLLALCGLLLVSYRQNSKAYASLAVPAH